MREAAAAVQKDQDDENPISPVEEAFGDNPGSKLKLFLDETRWQPQGWDPVNFQGEKSWRYNIAGEKG